MDKVKKRGSIIVAAANAPASMRKKADYLCDGQMDQVELEFAIKTARDMNMHIRFSGTFTCM